MPTSSPSVASARAGARKEAAWIYPLKGILYFFKTRDLRPLLRARLLPCILLSTLVLLTLFTFAWAPQALFLRIFHGPGAYLNATFLVLGESAAITALLFEAFFVDETLVDVFDAVLVARGHAALVANTRPVDPPSQENSPRTRLQRPTHSSIYSPFSLRQIIEFVLLLPLNLIPWAGVPLFLWLTGWRAGPLHHHRLFKLKGLTKKERKGWIKRRRVEYTGFGCVALALQLVPVLSMVFLVTTAAGSALWAARLEDGEGASQGRDAAAYGDGDVRSPTERSRLVSSPQFADRDDPPPAYEEYADNAV